MDERFEFRPVHPEEGHEAARIEQTCFPPNEADTEEHVLERVSTARELFLVAYDREEKRLAGFLNGVSTSGEHWNDRYFTDISLHEPDGETVMLCGLDVLPEYRHRGLARELVGRYGDLAREKGKKRLILTCHEEKIPMYRKFGFLDCGIAASSWGGEMWHEMERILYPDPDSRCAGTD